MISLTPLLMAATAALVVSGAVAAQAPLQVEIRGPADVEIGRAYRYEAAISGSQRAHVDAYWTLPDGQQARGRTIRYTPTNESATLIFTASVRGAPDTVATTSLQLRPWTYQWPADWRIAVSPSSPSSASYEIQPAGGDAELAALHGERLRLLWSLPRGLGTVSNSQALKGTFSVAEPGKYTASVRVSDSRGHYADVHSAEFIIAPAPTLATVLDILPAQDEQGHPVPLTYYAQVQSSDRAPLPPGVRHELVINGQSVGQFTESGHYFSVAEPGIYDVEVHTQGDGKGYGRAALKLRAR